MTRKGLLQSLAALIIAVGIVPNARAMYCGNRLISKGDSRAKVVALCGHPVDAQSRVVYITSSYGGAWPYAHQRYVAPSRYRIHHGVVQQRHTVPVTLEEWTFDMGSNRLMRVVTFEDGRVAHIRTLGYGFLRPGTRLAPAR